MKWLALLATFIALSGCGKLLSSGAVSPPSQAAEIVSVGEVEAVDYKKILADINNNKQSRNAVVMQLIGRSDVSCGEFISHLYGRRAVANVWYSNITTATAAAAAIVGGRAAQNLSGLSAVSNQTRSSINSEIYGGELIPNIAAEIGGLRSIAKAEIKENLKGELSEYPAELAVSDAISYHELCSVPVAMSSLMKKAGGKKNSEISIEPTLARIDDAVSKEKALLFDASVALSEDDRKTIQKRILELTEHRSNIIRFYSAPAVTSEQVE